MHKWSRKIVGLVGLLSCAVVPVSPAAIIAQDNFDSYTQGSIIGQGAAADGWLNAWGGQTSTNPTPVKEVVTGVFPPEANQSLAIGYSGSSLSTIRANAVTRQFTPQTDTFFVGFLLMTSGMSDNNDIFQLYFNNDSGTSSTGTNGSSLAFMITAGNRYLREGGEDESLAVANVDDVINRVVLKFSKSVPGGDFDQLALFVDQLDDSTPTHSIANTDAYSGPGDTISAFHLRMRCTSTADRTHLDELRIGTTYADVVPEPATLALLLLGAAAVRRRR